MKAAVFLVSVASASSAVVSAFVAPQVSSRGLTKMFGEDEDEEKEAMGGKSISGLTSQLETVFTSEDIDKILPHRYPFALVDKVVEYEAGKVR